MKRNQDEDLRREGYVTARAVADATGMVLSTVHRQIGKGKIPGQKVGSGWYVDVHAYRKIFDEQGPGASIRVKLDELAREVPEPKRAAEKLVLPKGKKAAPPPRRSARA